MRKNPLSDHFKYQIFVYGVWSNCPSLKSCKLSSRHGLSLSRKHIKQEFFHFMTEADILIFDCILQTVLLGNDPTEISLKYPEVNRWLVNQSF